MRLLRHAMFVWIVVAGGLVVPSAGFGQRNYPYTPRTPTLSPYFNYFRVNSGTISPYHQFVRPRVQLRMFVKQQSARNQRQNNLLQDQQTRIRQLEQRLSPQSGGSFTMYRDPFDPVINYGQAPLPQQTQMRTQTTRGQAAVRGSFGTAGGFMNSGAFYPEPNVPSRQTPKPVSRLR